MGRKDYENDDSEQDKDRVCETQLEIEERINATKDRIRQIQESALERLNKDPRGIVF